MRDDDRAAVEDEAMHRRLLDYSPEAETYDALTGSGADATSSEAVFSEADEMELAAGLLGVANRTELEGFLGDVIEQADRAIGKAVPASGKGALAGILFPTSMAL